MKRVASVFALSALVFAFGCQKGNFSQRESAAKANVFRYPIDANPTTLDPGMVQDGDTIDLLQNVFEGLVGWSTESKVAPLLCTGWDIKDGGKAYIFHLKKGVKFFNGREVHADDFKWTLERNCAPTFNSPVVADYLDDIVGFADYHAGKRSDLPGVKVNDPYTLEIDITAPRPYFIGKLTYLDAAVLCKEAVPQGGQIQRPDQMIGTGPFKCVEYVPNQIAVLEANKDYHEGAPLVDRIERPVLTDPATRLNKFKGGEVDLVQLEREDVAALQKDPTYGSQLHFFPRPAIFYAGMNPKGSPVFANRDVRRAFAMAVDRNEIAKDVLGGLVTPADGILPPGVLGHRDKTAILPFDPVAAKKSLAAAGFADPSKFPSVTLTIRSDRADYRLVASAVQSQLQANLGIKVDIQLTDWTAYLKTWDMGSLGFFHMRWMADYLDPQDFLSILLARYGNEDRGLNYDNPQFNALCQQADGEQNESKRLQLYAQAEDIALQDAPWIPLYFQQDAELISPRVQGIRESAFGHLPHTTVRLAH